MAFLVAIFSSQSMLNTDRDLIMEMLIPSLPRVTQAARKKTGYMCLCVCVCMCFFFCAYMIAMK